MSAAATTAEYLTAFDTISVRPLTPTIGAEIGGLRMSGDVPD